MCILHYLGSMTAVLRVMFAKICLFIYCSQFFNFIAENV